MTPFDKKRGVTELHSCCFNWILCLANVVLGICSTQKKNVGKPALQFGLKAFKMKAWLKILELFHASEEQSANADDSLKFLD